MQPQQISDREFRQERARLAELPFMNVFVCLHLRGRASQSTTKSPELFELAERVSRNSEDTGEAAQVADFLVFALGSDMYPSESERAAEVLVQSLQNFPDSTNNWLMARLRSAENDEGHPFRSAQIGLIIDKFVPRMPPLP